jgi:hypothetical protein
LRVNPNFPTQTGLLNIIEKISLRDEIEASAKEDYTGDKEELAEKMMDAPRVQERIALTMQELGKYQAREGMMFTKPYVLENAKTMAPAMWWATYGKHVPRISSVARRVLAQAVWCVCFRSRAQLVCLRRGEDEGAQQDGPRGRRQAGVLPRGAAYAQQAAEGGLQARGREVGHRF